MRPGAVENQSQAAEPRFAHDLSGDLHTTVPAAESVDLSYPNQTRPSACTQAGSRFPHEATAGGLRTPNLEHPGNPHPALTARCSCRASKIHKAVGASTEPKGSWMPGLLLCHCVDVLLPRRLQLLIQRKHHIKLLQLQLPQAEICDKKCWALVFGPTDLLISYHRAGNSWPSPKFEHLNLGGQPLIWLYGLTK